MSFVIGVCCLLKLQFTEERYQLHSMAPLFSFSSKFFGAIRLDSSIKNLEMSFVKKPTRLTDQTYNVTQKIYLWPCHFIFNANVNH